MRKRAIVGASVAVASLTVIGVELGARLVLGPPAVHMLTSAVHDVQADFEVVYGLTKDRTRVTCAAPATPERRLFFIGDSFTFGQGVVDGEDFVGRVSCRLPRARVVNLGVPGQDFVYYEIAVRSLVSADADDIVLLVYDNDLPYAGAESPAWSAKRALYRASHIVVMLRNAKQRMSRKLRDAKTSGAPVELSNPRNVAKTNPQFFSDIAHPSPERLALFDSAFVRFMRESRRAAPNARVFVAFAPEAATVSETHRAFYRSVADIALPEFGQPSRLNRRTQELCSRSERCSFIDLFPTLLQRGDAYYYPHDFHWNAEGHRVVAEVVLAALTRP